MSQPSSRFVIGQRYISESEPELGLGVISKVESKLVTILFPGPHGPRTYGMASAPLRRIKFEAGDDVIINGSEKISITRVEEREGILIYFSEGLHESGFAEAEIISSNSLDRPEERFLIGKFDSNSLFNLRYKTLQNKKMITHSAVRGLVGGRVSRIPHQLYIVDQIFKMEFPRVLLADEVGLGKTIEAGLVLHRLLTTDRAERVLIVVPDSLAYQWFVEMLRKFRLSFAVLNQETYLEKDSKPFIENNLVITGLGFLKGAEMARKMAMEAQWDVLVVDEAHQLKWTNEVPSVEYQLIEELAKKIPSVLLLTATPEQLGREGHFARLRLLDPVRFYNLNKYVEDGVHYEKIGQALKSIANYGPELKKLDRETIDFLNELHGSPINLADAAEVSKAIKEIVDRHGTGRIYFRNSRIKMAHEFKFFPKRFVHSYPLSFSVADIKSLKNEECEKYEDEQRLGHSFNAKAAWLVQFLQQNKDQKILLICHSKTKVLELDKVLRESVVGFNWGMFHSDLSLLARDRQAAYFSEPNGARVLLCTEIGSEGRNFAFCQHLVLFDLPQNPDLLEQRIGRLDRIGQKGDVNIHVPFITGTWEEIFYSWYDRGLSAFSQYSRAGRQIFAALKGDLLESFNHPKLYLSKSSAEFEKLIEKTLKTRKEAEQILDLGRDYLVELNSFDQAEANRIVELVKESEGGLELQNFMDTIFDHLGVDVEDLAADSIYVKPGDNMFIPHFPCLTQDGVTVTYNRNKALEREDFEFMTWDHPMVTGIVDTILDHQFGSVALASRQTKGPANKGYIEVIFVLAALGEKNVAVERFLPPTPIRVLINMEVEDLSEKWAKDVIDQKITEADNDQKKMAPKFCKDKLKVWLKAAQELALKKSLPIRTKAKDEVHSTFKAEMGRLEYLSTVNSNISQNDLEWCRKTEEKLLLTIDEATLRQDSFRVIL